MPTTLSTLSPRQQSYIAALAAERNVTARTDVMAAAAGTLAGTEASALIDRLLAMPRTPRSRATTDADRPAGGTDMPTPTTANRAGRMLAAGGIEATATLADGRHVTVQIRTRTRTGRGWTNAELGQDGATTNIRVFGGRVGWINRHGDQYRLTLRTRNDAYIAAVNAVLAYAAGEDTGLVRVQEASRCGRCMRTLTDPVSIDRGVGPECFGRSTGSRAATRNEAGETTTTVIIDDQAAADAAEARMNAAVAAAERAEHVRAYEAEAAEEVARGIGRVGASMESVGTTAARATESLTALAAAAASPVLTADQQRARDLIAEALDSYCNDRERDFAMGVFDRLAEAGS